MFAAGLVALLLPALVLGRELSKLQRDALPHQYAVRAPTLSLNVSNCPGMSQFSVNADQMQTTQQVTP